MQSKIERVRVKNAEAITKATAKLELVNYDTVSELLPKLIAKGELILDSSIYTPVDPISTNSTAIGRYLVYDHPDKENPFSIWVFAFAFRQKTSIHDHKYKGTVIVLDGEVSEKYYQPTGDNTARLIKRVDRYRFHCNKDDLEGNFVHQLKRRKGLGDGLGITLHIYNMEAHQITLEGEKIDNRNLSQIYFKDKVTGKDIVPDYTEEYPDSSQTYSL